VDRLCFQPADHGGARLVLGVTSLGLSEQYSHGDIGGGFQRTGEEAMARQLTGALRRSILLLAALAAAAVLAVGFLLFVAAGTLAVAGSLQQIYEKVFGQQHRGWRGSYRLLIWVVALCLVVALEAVAGRPVRDAAAGTGLVELVTFAIWAPFFWWTMHFLLAGRVPWRRLLPSAVFTGAFYVGLGVFSKFYFSSTITSDSRTYGTIGAILGILTWFVAIGAVIILGAVAGVVWDDRKTSRP
jgi:membrane protein